MAGKKVTTTPEETIMQEETPVKVYKFKAENPYLTVANLGIQFVHGKAETTNLNIARALARVGGVEMVEE